MSSSTITTPYTATAPRSTPLHGKVQADVIVVGAGIVGVSLAVQLAAGGADVALVTADAVGDGVTGRSSAKVTALHQMVYADLTDRHGASAAATYAAASSAALSWLRDAAGGVWEDRAAVTVARSEDERRDLAVEAVAALAAGLPVEAVNDVPDWPEDAEGLRLPGQGQVDPVALLQHLLDGVDGIRLFEGTRITGLRERLGGATVTADGGSASGAAVVVATGMPVFDRGGFFALCEPKASYIVALAHDGSDARTDHDEDMMITAGEPSRSLRWATDVRDGRRVLLVGGEGHRTGAGAPTTPRYERLEAWARERVDGLGEVVARWSAEDFMSPDRLPYAGPHLRIGGPVHIVTGLSKWGFTLGVACATALAARIDGGGTTAFGAMVDTARLPGVRGTATIVQANAQVARHMATGWAAGLTHSAPEDPAEGEGGAGRDAVAVHGRCRVDGVVHEVSAICPHLGGVVAWNDGDRTWDCPLHGSRFHADGTVRHGPATRGL